MFLRVQILWHKQLLFSDTANPHLQKPHCPRFCWTVNHTCVQNRSVHTPYTKTGCGAGLASALKPLDHIWELTNHILISLGAARRWVIINSPDWLKPQLKTNRTGEVRPCFHTSLCRVCARVCFASIPTLRCVGPLTWTSECGSTGCKWNQFSFPLYLYRSSFLMATFPTNTHIHTQGLVDMYTISHKACGNERKQGREILTYRLIFLKHALGIYIEGQALERAGNFKVEVLTIERTETQI